MEQESLDDVVKYANQNFPTTINAAGIQLTRKLLAIDTEEYPVETDQCISYVHSPREAEKLLWQLLEILDENLGQKYAGSSRALYHNTRPWRVNKWREMLTPGLVYVIYSTAATTTATQRRNAPFSPLLFLSFMLTEEDGLVADDPTEVWTVLYLYELQLLPRVRRLGLAARLLGDHLAQCGRQLCTRSRAGRFSKTRFFGLELTVFADNAPAIRLYESLGMQLAADSPTVLDTDSLYRLYVLQL